MSKTDYPTRTELFGAINLVLLNDIPAKGQNYASACLSCEGADQLSFEHPTTKMPWQEAVQKARRLLENEPGCDFQVRIHLGDTEWIFHRSAYFTGRGYISIQPAEPHD